MLVGGKEATSTYSLVSVYQWITQTAALRIRINASHLGAFNLFSVISYIPQIWIRYEQQRCVLGRTSSIGNDNYLAVAQLDNYQPAQVLDVVTAIVFVSKVSSIVETFIKTALKSHLSPFWTPCLSSTSSRQSGLRYFNESNQSMMISSLTIHPFDNSISLRH